MSHVKSSKINIQLNIIIVMMMNVMMKTIFLSFRKSVNNIYNSTIYHSSYNILRVNFGFLLEDDFRFVGSQNIVGFNF